MSGPEKSLQDIEDALPVLELAADLIDMWVKASLEEKIRVALAMPRLASLLGKLAKEDGR